jgi:hypothetical protein
MSIPATMWEQPMTRDFYRTIANTARQTSRGLNGPIFGRGACGGANNNGDIFRGRGELIYSRPVVGDRLPPLDHLTRKPSIFPDPLLISHSRLQVDRAVTAGRDHVFRLATMPRSPDGKVFTSALVWPERTMYTRTADGTSMLSSRRALEPLRRDPF